MFYGSCDDLTGDLPDGASSINLRINGATWQVFTEVQYEGASVDLRPGKAYKNLEQMGLQNPVKSFRKARRTPFAI